MPSVVVEEISQHCIWVTACEVLAEAVMKNECVLLDDAVVLRREFAFAHDYAVSFQRATYVCMLYVVHTN
jgi:hypothetical protein|eukprot:COSAG01_NODE_1928_length_8876_cov_12.801641_8_plen_70_part_00